MNPQSLTPKQIAHLLNTLAVLEQIGEAVKAHAIKLAHKGVVIPGYEASWTNAHRVWADDEQANTLLSKLGLEKQERYSVELLSPAQAEKALKAKKLWPRGKAATDFASPLDKVVAYTERNPSISKVSGPSKKT